MMSRKLKNSIVIKTKDLTKPEPLDITEEVLREDTLEFYSNQGAGKHFLFKKLAEVDNIKKDKELGE